ncbi:hypothetical protein D9758_013997 [Tetrapyrgos nigripes]|uniref:RNase H type-1 domain-containing protein n=1 Tax=Tetrapyrgos nigripes TaxID=182062 RepID=A0A8H5G7P7_9AGAR|nr:hypothetical protein D9758_013997 [Tetrapyrgos nigripes]
MTVAWELLDILPQKWDPRREQPEDYEKEPHITNERNTTYFDNRVTTNGTLGDIFQIFTDKKLTPSDYTPDNQIIHMSEPTIVGTNGSCINNGCENAVAGAGIFFAAEDAWNHALKVPSQIGDTHITQSNQTGELLAAKTAAKIVSVDTELEIETDSKYVIGHLTSKFAKNGR